ncbi:hypothetical protein E2562_033640 [Oryza meyeriana var. granulata]|uniref:Uncharacterized protein n=1 Tax=Oryza meyeriana var. granulata TaxID=110450 RepID=A0A6G1CA90_9ORYZ|nr:hypothetical protein E2562_033640 [Oryza meyeriana var. granulata]
MPPRPAPARARLPAWPRPSARATAAAHSPIFPRSQHTIEHRAPRCRPGLPQNPPAPVRLRLLSAPPLAPAASLAPPCILSCRRQALLPRPPSSVRLRLLFAHASAVAPAGLPLPLPVRRAAAPAPPPPLREPPPCHSVRAAAVALFQRRRRRSPNAVVMLCRHW